MFRYVHPECFVVHFGSYQQSQRAPAADQLICQLLWARRGGILLGVTPCLQSSYIGTALSSLCFLRFLISTLLWLRLRLRRLY